MVRESLHLTPNNLPETTLDRYMNDDYNHNEISGYGAEGLSRVELKVLGISYSQIQSGAYAMILAEKDGGPIRLPVVVGGMEAQSIAIKLEGIIPPRPMTHDLFVSLMHAYGLQLQEVFIYKFEDGIFSSELLFIDCDGKRVQLDARTSDAIAISMRCGAPIFTTREIIAETGFLMEPGPQTSLDETVENAPEAEKPAKKLAELKQALAKAIEEEAYEEASRITRQINAIESSELSDLSEPSETTE